MSIINKYIDKVIYINLDKRTDRRAELEQELNRFDVPYERFSAHYNNSGIVGCGYSHLSVIKLAKERNYKNILILEDDFTFTVNKEKFENLICSFYENTELAQSCDVLFISYLTINIEKTEVVPDNTLVGRLISGTNASGYIISNHYYDKLIELYEHNLPLLEQTGQHWIYANDQIWKQLQEKDNWYYFIERIGKQKSGYSDNSKITNNFDNL
jgi:glycosyl transferase family 25